MNDILMQAQAVRDLVDRIHELPSADMCIEDFNDMFHALLNGQLVIVKVHEDGEINIIIE